MDGRHAGVPHLEAILVAEKDPAFPKVFVVGIDPAADVAVGVDPRAGFDVDAGTYETDRRSAFVGLDQGAFRFVVEDWVLRELAQRAELKKQRPRFGRIRIRIAHLAGTEIDVDVRQARRRVEGRK